MTGWRTRIKGVKDLDKIKDNEVIVTRERRFIERVFEDGYAPQGR